MANFSADGQRIVTASHDNTAQVWDAESGRPVGEPLRHEGWVSAASFSPDGQRIVTASRDRTARVWDVRSHALASPLAGYLPNAWSVAFHPEGRLLAAGTDHAVRNKANDYLIDRALQASGKSYTGMTGFGTQDCAIQESMGPIADRTKENLVATDNAIIMARLRLRKAAQAVADGKRAPGLDEEAQSVRSASST